MSQLTNCALNYVLESMIFLDIRWPKTVLTFPIVTNATYHFLNDSPRIVRKLDSSQIWDKCCSTMQAASSQQPINSHILMFICVVLDSKIGTWILFLSKIDADVSCELLQVNKFIGICSILSLNSWCLQPFPESW